MKVRHVSTEGLVDPRQIGWVGYEEGEAIVYVKVIRGRGRVPFLSHPTAHALGTTWPCILYENKEKWKEKSTILLRRFREEVGDEYFYHAQPRQKAIANGSPSKV